MARAKVEPKIEVVEIRHLPERAASPGDDFWHGSIWTRADPRTDLRGPGGTAILERMALDAEIAAGLGHIKWPLLAGNWRVDPYDSDDPVDVEIAEEAERMLMPSSDGGMGSVWAERLDFALTALETGFSLFEVLWDDVAGMKTIASLEPILPATVHKWNYDRATGEWVGFTQRARWPDGEFRDKDVEARLLCPIVFNRRGASMWGRALTAPAYLSWYSKKQLLIMDGIIKERFGGIPVAEDLPGSVNGETEVQALKDVIRNFRIHHEQSLYAAGYKITVIFPSGANSNVLESVRYHDAQMAQLLMTELMKVGLSESGGRAVTDTKAGLLFIAIGGIVRPFADAFSKYVVAPFVRANWGERPGYPRVVPPDFQKMRSGELVPLVKQMVDARVITPDDALEAYMRKQLTVPAAEAATARPAPAAVPPGSVAPEVPAKRESESSAPAKRLAEHGAVPRAFRRDRFPQEAHAAFEEYADHLDRSPRELWYRGVAQLRKQMAMGIAKAAARASDSQLASGTFTAQSPRPLAERISRGLLATYLYGRKTVVVEARRQGAASAQRFQDEDDDELEAELRDAGATKAQVGWIKTLALTLATGIIGAMVTRAKEEAVTQRQSDASVADQQAAVAAALEGLSVERQIADLGGQMSRAFSTGRNEQAEAMGADVATAFYSAIMDDGTCEPCASLDGAEHEIGDPNFETPNPNCAWPPYCRCITIPVFRTAEAAA